ncbi:hypothetical protein VXM97_03140 [Helicobacter pylori]|uniref:hypothetical protein n=1 Tax=Helicobacter pylori TaxID=210 RepID=UPI002F354AAF
MSRLGVSERIHIEWLRETNEPIAMKAVLDILSQLKDDGIIQVIENWKQEVVGKK